MIDDRIKEAFENPRTYCSGIMLLLIDRFGSEVLDWEPATIEMELSALGIRMNQLLSDKINAGLALIGTDLYFKSIDGFNAVNTAFSLKPVDTRAFRPLSLDDIMWGVTEAKFLLGPADYDLQEYGHDIALYTGLSLSVEGITNPPAMLAFAEFDAGEIDKRDQALMNDLPFAEAYWQRQEQARKELNDAASIKLTDLLKQLQDLPLKNAVPDLRERIDNILKDIQGEPDETGTQTENQDNAPSA